MPVQTQILTRRGTAASWTSTNPTLGAGEIGYETDTGNFKIGTGSTAWASLAYFNRDPLTTKGDLYTFSTTDARLAVGNSGEQLVADSSTATGLRYNASANANLIAGGSFDIWQRGTGAFTTNGTYTSDRFYVYSSSSFSLSQESSVVPDGATYSAKITSTAGSSFANMQFALEQTEVEKLAGKVVTFSVYLRANGTYNGTTALKINTSTTGNSQTPTWTTQATSTIAAPSTSAFTRFTVTATIPTTAKGLAFLIEQQAVLASGSIYYIGLAKAELGSVATPFVRAGGTIQGELAACQRYYYRAVGGNNNSAYAMGTATSTTVANFIVQLPVTFRTLTSATIDTGNLCISDGVTAASGGTFTSSGVLSSQNIGFVIYTHGSAALTQYRPYRIENNTNSAGYIGFSAEL
jgi:hypothetical protein